MLLGAIFLNYQAKQQAVSWTFHCIHLELNIALQSCLFSDVFSMLKSKTMLIALQVSEILCSVHTVSSAAIPCWWKDYILYTFPRNTSCTSVVSMLSCMLKSMATVAVLAFCMWFQWPKGDAFWSCSTYIIYRMEGHVTPWPNRRACRLPVEMLHSTVH